MPSDSPQTGDAPVLAGKAPAATAPTATLSAADRALAEMTVVPARHLGRRLGSLTMLAVAGLAGYTLVTNPAWDWPTVRAYLFHDAVLRAVWLTIELTFLGIAVGFLLGGVVALMRLARSPLVRSVAWAYVWFFRSVPLILQLLFWYNLAILYRSVSLEVPFGPTLFETSTVDLISPMTAAALGLGLHQAAYAAEIIRAGLLSVGHGQREAAAALGIPRVQQLTRIILPQAMRVVVPNAANDIVALLKGTSVVYIMALPELFYQVQVIYNRNGRVIALLLVATIWYVALTSVLSLVQYAVERHYARGQAGTAQRSGNHR